LASTKKFIRKKTLIEEEEDLIKEEKPNRKEYFNSIFYNRNKYKNDKKENILKKPKKVLIDEIDYEDKHRKAPEKFEYGYISKNNLKLIDVINNEIENKKKNLDLKKNNSSPKIFHNIKKEKSLLNFFNLTYDEKNNQLNKNISLINETKDIIGLNDGRIERLLIQKAKKDVDKRVNPIKILENHQLKKNKIKNINNSTNHFFNVEFSDEKDKNDSNLISPNSDIKHKKSDINNSNNIKTFICLKDNKNHINNSFHENSSDNHSKNANTSQSEDLFKFNILNHNEKIIEFKKKYFHSYYNQDNILNKKRNRSDDENIGI